MLHTNFDFDICLDDLITGTIHVWIDGRSPPRWRQAAKSTIAWSMRRHRHQCASTNGLSKILRST